MLLIRLTTTEELPSDVTNDIADIVSCVFFF